MIERPNFIDYSRVVGIYLVILGHYAYAMEIPFCNSFLWKVEHSITLFHMPLFFLLSGVLFRFTDIKTLYKKTKEQLLVPYLSISMFVFLAVEVLSVLRGDFNSNDVCSHLIGIICANDCWNLGRNSYTGALWFLIALALIKFLVWWCENGKYSKCKALALGLLGGGIMFLPNIIPFRVDSALVGFIFFYTGYKFRDQIYKIMSLKTGNLILVLVLSLIVLSISAYINLDFNYFQGLSINANYYGKYPPMFIISGISGSIVIMIISQLLSRNKNTTIYNISNGTIIVLGAHFTLFKSVAGIISFDSIIIASLLSLVNLAACYFLILFTNRVVPFINGNRKIR